MACSNPHNAIIVSFADGNRTVKFIEKSNLEVDEFDEWYYKNKVFTNALSVRQVLIPCGHCEGCKLDYARTWALRCVHESKLHAENCFLTLTYSNDNLPADSKLVKKDIQDFMKRLRFFLGDVKVRFYCVGEYGSKNKRPHYHMILFGYIPKDLYEFGFSNNNRIFRSEFLESVWKHGYVFVGTVTYESCAYVARYVLKKVETDPNYKEFSLMSRRPGIGKGYFEHYYKDFYSVDGCYMKCFDKSTGHTSYKKRKIPRYYDKLFSQIDPIKYLEIKEKRIEAASQVPLPFNEKGHWSATSEARYFIHKDNVEHLPRALHEDSIETLFNCYDKFL